MFIVFKDGVEELNLVFKFSIEGFIDSIFASSDTDMKYFKCDSILFILFMPLPRGRVTAVFLSDRTKMQLSLLGPSLLWL